MGKTPDWERVYSELLDDYIERGEALDRINSEREMERKMNEKYQTELEAARKAVEELVSNHDLYHSLLVEVGLRAMELIDLCKAYRILTYPHENEYLFEAIMARIVQVREIAQTRSSPQWAESTREVNDGD